jgi:hypothetical protein
MHVKAKFTRQLASVSLGLILVAVSCFAGDQSRNSQPRPNQSSRQQAPRPQQQRQNRPAPQPRYQQRRQERAPQQRYQAAPQPRHEPAPQQRYVPQPYRPPAQGHHSGQWLEQHREQPYDQQRRALENDPTFRRLPQQRQQQLEQRLQRFNSLPPDRQQRVLQRMETWEHLTGTQKQEFRSMSSQFRSLPPERQQAVRNAIDSLRAMPPDARQRAIQSNRFSEFSPQERQILNNAARLPLAPAQGNQTQSPSTGPGRYVPRPPH